MATVLVAEDNPDHQRVIVEVVRRLGHEVTAADDGFSALRAATDRRPDLVIADIDMPKLNGLQLCRTLHEDPSLRDVPVILVTALSPREQEDTADCAPVATVHKPFDLRQLSRVIAETLRSGVASDVTESPDFVDALLRNVDLGLAACDTEGRLVFYNKGLHDFFGPGGAGIPVGQWAERFHLRHHDGRPLTAGELPMIRALAGETVHAAGLLATDRQGRHHWLTLNARPVRDRQGTIIGAAVAVRDVTVDHRIQVYEGCKTAVLEALTSGSNARTARQAAIGAVGSRLGWSHVRLWMADPVTDRLQPDATYTAPEDHPLPTPDGFGPGEGLAGHCWQRGELVWVPDIHADGSPVVPEIRADPRFRAAGAVPVQAGRQILGVMTFYSYDPQEPEPALATLLTGIAGTIGAHLQQHRADDLARHLAAITDEYVALAGHELRTPLTSITAYSQILADTPDLPSDVRPMVDVIERNSRKLRDLIDQLLDLAALDAGHLELAHDPVDLLEVSEAAVDRLRAAAAARRITVTVRAAGELVVRGDADRLRQVVVNLLDNAVKFSSDDSTVTVEIRREDGAAVLSVTDAGSGLPGDRTSDLFRRLYRGGNARHTGVPGNGLGLALCRTIVSHHHGSITLTPNQPAGTTASVRLPVDGAG